MPAKNKARYSDSEWDAAFRAWVAAWAEARSLLREDDLAGVEDSFMAWKPGQSGGWGDNSRFQIACESYEGKYGQWAVALSERISDAMPDGWHVEPYTEWLLTVYKD